MTTQRLAITQAAKDMVKKLKSEYGELVFNQSGGCCDGTAPMCYQKDDFYVPSRNIKLGEICGCEFFISAEQFEYFKHSHITIDCKDNKSGSNSFSLETAEDKQFVTISRIFTDEEYRNLKEQ
jgi:uncharacterized protein (DUF779 family)